MIKYKLTTQQITTYNNTKWEIGVTKKTSGEGELCDSGWLHCYDNPVLAVLLNSIHANIENPRLWEVEVGGMEKHDRGLKSGYTEMTLIREIPLPVLTHEQRVKFAILCAKQVCTDANWNEWADNWLTGKDRTKESAYAAYAAAYAAAYTAAAYAAYAAAYAAYVAANAADSAACNNIAIDFDKIIDEITKS